MAKPKAIDEDDGWIITFAHDEDNDNSYVSTNQTPFPDSYWDVFIQINTKN